MQCEEFEDRLNAVLDERRRPEWDAELRLHCETCRECREVAASYGAALDGFYSHCAEESTDADLSDYGRPRVGRFVTATVGPATARRVTLAAAAAALATAAGLLIAFTQPLRSPELAQQSPALAPQAPALAPQAPAKPVVEVAATPAEDAPSPGGNRPRETDGPGRGRHFRRGQAGAKADRFAQVAQFASHREPRPVCRTWPKRPAAVWPRWSSWSRASAAAVAFSTPERPDLIASPPGRSKSAKV